MRTFIRKLSHRDTHELVVLMGHKGLAAKLSEATKVLLAGFQKKCGEYFSVEIEDLKARRKIAFATGQEVVEWDPKDKVKKSVELKHTELSAIANAFLDVLKLDTTGLDVSSQIMRLASGDCLMLERWIDRNAKIEAMELIDVPEDADLIAEDSTEPS